MRILITGVAGFIGFHVAEELSKFAGIKIYGLDNLNNYYDINLKKIRLTILKKKKISFLKKLILLIRKKLIHLLKQTKLKLLFI